LWLEDTFGVTGAKPFVAPPVQERPAPVCLSWGVGENEDKRIGDLFETAVTKELIARHGPVLLDCGAGGREKERAVELQRECGTEALALHDGSYASFAGHIVGSRLYVGYDSVGQHVASAAGVPLVSVFAGFPCERMFSRWRPGGENAQVIAVEEFARDQALSRTLEAIG
jgi:ADP-heptose:LPS heptosyltransferase